jgi:hypothetical protein
VPRGHKLAVRSVQSGEPVRKYGQVIGYAATDIDPGDHVHTHNLTYRWVETQVVYGSRRTPTDYVPPDQYDPVNATGLVAGGDRTLLHHRPRLGLRLPPDAMPRARHQHRAVPADDRRHGPQLRHDRRRRGDGGGGGQRIFELILATASGQRTRSEELGFGLEEFVPWQLGATL